MPREIFCIQVKKQWVCVGFQNISSNMMPIRFFQHLLKEDYYIKTPKPICNKFDEPNYMIFYPQKELILTIIIDSWRE